MFKPILLGAQRGLPMHARFGNVLTLSLRDHQRETRDEILSLIRAMDGQIEAPEDYGLVAAFEPGLWGAWMGREIPVHTKVLDNSLKFTHTGGDVLLYLKTPDHASAKNWLAPFMPELERLCDAIECVTVGKRPDGKVMGGRYLDGITNPNDPVSMAEDILLAGDYPGACFGFTQKFVFDWTSIAAMAADDQDEMIGRQPSGTVLPQHATHSHIHRAHILDENGDNRKLLRQALPFGEEAGHAGRERGLMFVAFCNEQPRFEKILHHLVGEVPERPVDRLMSVVQGVSGGYWYVPSASEAGVSAVGSVDAVYEEAHWDVRSENGYLFYNSQDYLHQMSEGRYIAGDPPSDRVLGLLGRTFSHWRDGWSKRQPFPRLPHLSSLLTDDEAWVATASVALRKGLANQKTLANLLSSVDSEIAHANDLLRIDARELLVGIIPDFTLGRGKEVVPYLSEAETVAAWLKGELNEWSAMGHVIPDYQTLVTQGLGAILADLTQRYQAAQATQSSQEADFYQSAIWSIQGVQGYLRNWSVLAQQTATRSHGENAANMQEVADRLMRLTTDAPVSFQDAVQLVYSFHCCLHLVGELTSIGRLDQILWPFLARDTIAPERAQEIIDCLWAKIGENAFVNRGFITDYVTYGTTAVCGLGGNFPQGGGINQWVQQITVGGYLPTEDATPQGGANPVTMLCLKAARRIPVSAPTLSLRVYPGMDDALLDEAAKGILSGGAQPILYQDDKLCEALRRSGKDVSVRWSRDYAADGCYEPMLAGASEFAFNNVGVLTALELTLNQGASYNTAGPEYLRGSKQTFRSPPASEIRSFAQLQEVFLKQLEWLVVQSYNTILGAYGNLADVCPSPLLSVLIDGCVDKGRDQTRGGARFHIIAPLCVGVSNAIDSLYAIQKLVFDPATAVTTLPELVTGLICDWGFNMIEPYQNQLLGAASAEEQGRRYQELREIALALPKWGSGNAEINELGNWLMDHLVDVCVRTMRDPSPALKPTLDSIAQNYGGFEFVVTPGIGTFEGYVGDGAVCGASADGRRNGMPVASDLSPSPAAQDLPASPAFRNIYQAMTSWQAESIELGLSNASPVDMNIEESFPLDDLRAFIRAYAEGGVGSNLVTLTCADLATYQAAGADPERYDLVRVRMGGWTEFYATMFPAHQDQHQRRQYFTP